MLTELFDAYRLIREARRKERELARVKMSPLNVPILRELINSARYDVVAHLKLVDGTQIEIHRRDDFDRMQDRAARIITLPDGTKVRAADLY